MRPPKTSVIIVSRKRPAHLQLCLFALTMQDHPDFEIILIADPDGLAQCPDLPIKRAAFDQSNISMARNLGIGLSAGKIIAFIDDDAVAEPGWLAQLTAPLNDPAIIAATGWTRDRNGFSWQMQSQRIGPDGWGIPIPAARDHAVRIRPPANGMPISTLGTNCAFRADALREVGGFDPVFSFHLDESDVNMRMAAAFPDAMTAIVPAAQVIHARAGSERRKHNQTPRDLTMQGRSTVLFARRHGAFPPVTEAIHRKRRRLLRHMLEGRLDPFHLTPVLNTLRQGLADGITAILPDPPKARRDNPPPFNPIPTRQRSSTVFGGWYWHARELRNRAEKAVSKGKITTLILLTPSFIPHRTQLTTGGWFEQTGGIWGASEPDDPPASFWKMQERLTREIKMTDLRRNLSVWSAVSA
ncbi:MAG: glycosyltransferase family 2 protein [Paracoccus sp. (in: a-proteobacteria)]